MISELQANPKLILMKGFLSIFLFLTIFTLGTVANHVQYESATDAKTLAEKLFTSNSITIHELKPELLLGSPKLIRHNDTIDPSVVFHSKPSDSLTLAPREDSLLCPWSIVSCEEDHVTLNLKLNQRNNEKIESNIHVLTMVLKNGFQLTLNLPMNKDLLFVQILRNGRSEVNSVVFEKDNLISLSISVNIVTGKLEKVTLDNRAVLITLIDSQIDITKPDVVTEDSDFIGLVFGGSHVGQFEISEFDIYEEDLAMKRTKRDYTSVQQGNRMSMGNVSGLDFSKGGYVSYNLKNRIPEAQNDEEVSIKFMLPYGNTEGTLWNAKGESSETLIYIKDSILYYTFRKKDAREGVTMTITEEVILNQPLQPNVVHHLVLTRRDKFMTVKLNSKKQEEVLSGRASIYPSGGILYIGGSPNPSADSYGLVSKQFMGNISDIQLYIDKSIISKSQHYDLIRMASDPQWKNIVNPGNGVKYLISTTPRRYQDHSTLIISPTSGYIDQRERSSGQPQSISLDGSPNAVMRDNTWDFDRRPFFEITFRTFENEGILFFVGPSDQHTDFVCVELFDGYVYFVYRISEHSRHIQLNPNHQKINDGQEYSVYVERDANHRFKAKFNGNQVDVDQPATATHMTAFASFTYFGSIDQISRLPWEVWSRKNFAGCITGIRIGDNEYIDFTLIMNQHQDATRGVRLECKTSPKVCTLSLCNAGKCYERYTPIYNVDKKFSCDCSATTMTYDPQVDIRRSEKCTRPAPIIRFDGETSYIVDFKNTPRTYIATHTDDFNLQFKTTEQNGPLFHTVSPIDRKYFKVDLYNGLVTVRTNINRGANTDGEQLFELKSSNLADGQWHNMKILRRAGFVYIEVDGQTKEGEIPIMDNAFQIIAQQLYIGAEAPKDYNTYNPNLPVSRDGLKFNGEMRNFYWNQYDFFGNTDDGRYNTKIITPKFEPPQLPSFRGKPDYSVTTTAQLLFINIIDNIDLIEKQDSLLINFKTKYDGVILHARESGIDSFLTIMLLNDRLHLIYKINDISGVHVSTSGPNNAILTNNQWHRVSLTVNRRDGQLILFVDNNPAQYINERFDFTNLERLTMYMAGMPDVEWRNVFNTLRQHSPSAVTPSMSQRFPAITGCFGGLSFASDEFKTDLLMYNYDKVKAYPPDQLRINGCFDVERCDASTCNNNGVCGYRQDGHIYCDCRSGYDGPRCMSKAMQCYEGYCMNGGLCNVNGNRLQCDCRLTAYTGQRCDISPCHQDYCKRGRCYVEGLTPKCDCFGTGFTGPQCDQSLCPEGYCGNGKCVINARNQPMCDCNDSGYRGSRCEIPLCTPSPCRNGGHCRYNGVREICDCQGTKFTGDTCEQPTCEQNYCLNNGICRVDTRRQSLACDCQGTGFIGNRCEINPCESRKCENGGKCIVRNNRAECDCTNTGFMGMNCDDSLCSRMNCNQGTCEIRNGVPYCRCHQGYQGLYCTESMCEPNYCTNGGSCYIYNGRRQCNCLNNFEGSRCEREKRCSPNYCLHGSCEVLSNGDFRCNCNDGYTGEKCENSKECPVDYCYGGKCTVGADGKYMCDCSPTARSGSRCQEDSIGFLSEYIYPGYLVHNFSPPKMTTSDSVTVGFKTYAKNGNIITFKSPRENFWSLKVHDSDLMFEENNQKPFTIKQNVNNGNYHVIRVERRDLFMNITAPNAAIQTFLKSYQDDYDRYKAITYDTLIIGANATEGNIFRGAIGGVYWNGEYLIDQSKRYPNNNIRMNITYVNLPNFKISSEPNVFCHSSQCKNRGICLIDNYQVRCECRFTGYWGDRCERQYYGYKDIERDMGTYTLINMNPEKVTQSDLMRFAFQTRESGGVLTHNEASGGNPYHQIYIKNGYLFANINGRDYQISQKRVDNGEYQVVNLDRNKNDFSYKINGEGRTVSDTSIVNSAGELNTKKIYIGADSSGNNNFKGVLGAFSWNEQELINKEGKFTENSEIMRTPGNMPGNKDEVHITVMPTFPDSVTVAAPLNIPDFIPNTGGGSVMSPNGDYLVAGEQENYYSGGGKADIFPGGGTRIQTAGLGTGLPQISALAAGIILSGLLLISGLIWACWKCKPGKCGSGGGKSSTFLKKAAAALGGTGSERELYTNRGVEGYQEAANYDQVIEMNEGTGLLESAGGYSTGGFAAAGAGMAGAGMAGYGHGKMLDLSPGMDVNSYRMERFEEVAGPNVYNADMKVDCCEISANSKYAVTGSANGPPQVWDMVSGDLFKVMDGSELAARDLHLGCDDQVLVGQVVDDINIDQAMETRRLQLWHFQTGQQMEMQENVMCTATCLTNMDKNDAIVARVQPEGPSILVWDLVGNEAKNRIAYNPISNDPVTYLRTSLNDRLVVAGVGGENGKPAYYMVFDLCANNSRMVDPKVIEFDAEIGATEILSDFEAVTGTRDGNLFVWNMMTCQPIRQIQMSAIIEDKSMVALPPHNGTIHCVTLSKDGQYIVTGSADQTVKVWKRYEEQLLHSLEGHNDDVLSVFISPDSEVIVSGSWDGSIRVWRLRDGNQMCWFTSNIEILQVKLSNDKRAIIGLGERNGNRKLIMLQIIRNRTTVYGPNGSLSPSLGPASP